MIQVKNLTMTHTRDLKDIIQDLSFTIHPGEKVALIGDEGTGKSTLLHWIANPNALPDDVTVEGEIINHFGRIGYLPQFLPSEYHSLSVAAYLFDHEEAWEMDFANLYSLAGQMGIDGDLLDSDRKLGKLSGGEQLKVQLLRLLAMEPGLILLDEPSNNLDIEAIQWLEHFISTSSTTIFFISHDEALLRATANKIIHLELQKHRTIPKATVANLGYQAYVDQRYREISKATQVGNKQREDYQKQMDRFRRIESATRHNVESTHDATAGRLAAKKFATVKAMGKRFEREAEAFIDIPFREEVIDLHFDHVQVLPQHKEIIHWQNKDLLLANGLWHKGLNFRWQTPEKIGLVGSNGIGKTSLMREILGEIRATPLFSVGYMPQNYQEVMSMEETVLDFLSFEGSKEEITQIMTYLGAMKFTVEEMERPLGKLSGGQQAKILFIKMDLDENNILILDEPTRNFSPLSQPELRQTLAEFSGAIFTISHDRLFLKEVCDKVYELSASGLNLIEI